MPHTLILGVTESGKTTLATELAEEFKKQGYKILVLTAIYDPRWKADFYTEDPDKFLEVFWDSESCIAFVDEAGETVGRYSDAMNKLATRGRHHGHAVFFITQKATSISLTVREQVSNVFMFASAPSTAKIMAEEFNQPGLLEALTLKRGEYIEARRFGDDGKPYLEKGWVFKVGEKHAEGAD